MECGSFFDLKSEWSWDVIWKKESLYLLLSIIVKKCLTAIVCLIKM